MNLNEKIYINLHSIKISVRKMAKKQDKKRATHGKILSDGFKLIARIEVVMFFRPFRFGIGQ